MRLCKGLCVRNVFTPNFSHISSNNCIMVIRNIVSWQVEVQSYIANKFGFPQSFSMHLTVSFSVHRSDNGLNSVSFVRRLVAALSIRVNKKSCRLCDRSATCERLYSSTAYLYRISFASVNLQSHSLRNW